MFLELTKAYNSDRRQVLHNIFIQFGTPIIQVRIIKVRLNETYSKGYLSGAFLFTVVQNEEMFCPHSIPILV
jgi:hypothetical protein